MYMKYLMLVFLFLSAPITAQAVVWYDTTPPSGAVAPLGQTDGALPNYSGVGFVAPIDQEVDASNSGPTEDQFGVQDQATDAISSQTAVTAQGATQRPFWKYIFIVLFGGVFIFALLKRYHYL